MIAFMRDKVRIGVDPAVDAFRLVAVCGDVVRAAIEVPVVEGEVSRADAARRAFAAAERQGIADVRECVAVAPMHAVTTAILELPPRSSGAPVESLAAAEMMRGSDGAGIEVVLFEIRSKPDGPVEYFVTGAHRDAITTLIDDLAVCGVRIAAVDAPVCALGRACDATGCMVVSLGGMGLEFHVVHQGQPILSRSVSLTRSQPSSETLIAEIDRCAGYLSTYRAESAIEEIVLVGGGADAPGMVDAIDREFDVNVRVWGESVRLESGQCLRPAFAGAFGAAMWHHAGRAAA